MKSLIVYFSAEFGATKKLADQLAATLSADIFEIRPEKPYTQADLRYMNPLARCNREKMGKNIYLFATSGGSGIGKTAEKLAPYIKGGTLAGAKKVGAVAELKE